MTAATAQSAATDGGHRVLAALCVTQVTSWGVLYYAFPVLSGPISLDTGWTASTLAAAFSAGLGVSAVFGVVVGRWLDRRGPRRLMTLGSLVAASAVVAIAAAPTLGWFVAAWLLAGVAMSAVLYPPAFAALTRWYGSRAVGALTMLTLAGGLASTLFAPLTAALAGPLGWRGTYLVLAGVLLVVTVPGHLVGLNRPWPTSPPVTHARQAPDRVLRSPAFLALVAALALAACASHAVVVTLVPLLAERHIPLGLAAVALGLGGAGQVLGRLGYQRLARRTGVRVRTTLTLAGVAVTTALLAAFTGLAALAALAALAGVARGTVTLVQATAVTDRWGAAHYGRLSGVLAAPVTMAAAIAPWVGALLADVLGGYGAMFWVMAGVAATAALLGWASVPSPIRGRRGEPYDTQGSPVSRFSNRVSRWTSQPCAAGSSSPTNVSTRPRISSRIGRTDSTPLPAGSSRTQSSYRFPG